MLFFDNVTKKYEKDITALEDICFKADKGEFLFLVGPSGAGKTTLMRLLIREELPTEGNILFDNIEVPKLPKKLLPSYRQRLGVIFQDMKLLENKTLEENVNFALEILGKEDKEVKDTTEYLLDLVGLKNRKHLFPVQLSGGEQQRGAIARALANNPELLVADEPTGNLDPENALHILDILNKINKTGTTVMVISHDKEIVDKQKARVLRMDKGKIVSDSNGGYNSQGKPVKPKVEKIKTSEKEKLDNKDIKPKKKNEKDSIIDETLKDLDKKILKKLQSFNITNIDMVLNLTDKDLDNMKINKREKKNLENFVKNYLSKK